MRWIIANFIVFSFFDNGVFGLLNIRRKISPKCPEDEDNYNSEEDVHCKNDKSNAIANIPITIKAVHSPSFDAQPLLYSPMTSFLLETRAIK